MQKNKNKINRDFYPAVTQYKPKTTTVFANWDFHKTDAEYKKHCDH